MTLIGVAGGDDTGGVPLDEVKAGRHGCGYPLLLEATTQFRETVVVNYRDNAAGKVPMVTGCCPGCGEALRIWWPFAAWKSWYGGGV